MELLRPQTFPLDRSQWALRLITNGRLTGCSHIVELRYVALDGSFFVLAGNATSDWVRNIFRSGNGKARIEDAIYEIAVKTATDAEKERVLESFLRKYGSSIVDRWYSKAQLCIRLDPVGQPVMRGAVSGETQPVVDFSQWKKDGTSYYKSIGEAFDSASEEYDYTIRHNYINTWIRKRSIRELVRLTKQSDVLLEIGCGTGTEAIQIAKHVTGIVATDLSTRMLHILKRKVSAKKLDHKIVALKLRASEISEVADHLPNGKVRIAYSFNGALNCEPEIRKIPEHLSKIIDEGGYFLCSIRNTLCLPEILSHSIVFQFDKMAARKEQPIMVSVGGIDIPSYYYSTREFVEFFRPYFRIKKIVGLPAFLPPAYLNDYFVRSGSLGSSLEKLELVLGNRFPFNRLGDQTLFVFQKK
jgi:SAM-dependent methyltransferase